MEYPKMKHYNYYVKVFERPFTNKHHISWRNMSAFIWYSTRYNGLGKSTDNYKNVE